MIDSELTKALLQPDENLQIGKDAPIRDMVKAPNLDWETEFDIGTNRTADIMVFLLYKYHSRKQVVVEVENDRKFEVETVLRKIKRQHDYPTIAIIPKEFERHSYQFQKSGIPVWYWTATCKWKCRACDNITTSSSSLTPPRCIHCNKQGFLKWIEPENIEFTPAEKNPELKWRHSGNGLVAL